MRICLGKARHAEAAVDVACCSSGVRQQEPRLCRHTRLVSVAVGPAWDHCHSPAHSLALSQGTYNCPLQDMVSG